MRPLRIAHVAPVATSVPPPKSGSVQAMTSILTEGLVARGHDVTLFATGDSRTAARLHATCARGYWHDETMWPWDFYEMMHVAAAVERAAEFDVIHLEALYYPISLPFTRLSRTPIVQTVHHAPSADEIALWSRYPEAPFIAISEAQARSMAGLHVAAVVLHGIDVARFTFRDTPDDYLLFLGRFTAGKGVLEAIEVARRVGMKLVLVAKDEPYYREHVAPHVDGQQIIYAGEADFDAKVALYGGARALLYPVQAGEPFGLVLAEAMACGTPVAALNLGAVPEIVRDGVSGFAFPDLDALTHGLDRVLALDRRAVRAYAEHHLGADRMVDEYVSAYRTIVAAALTLR